MAGAAELHGFGDALVVLATAGIVVPVGRRFGLSPILAYLAAGAVLGPSGLGGLAWRFPALSFVSITDIRHIASIADLGVVFLLFLIGLELSFERLTSLRRLVFGLGGMQIVLSMAAIAVCFLLAGEPASTAIIFAGCLSLSSTAIVIELLSQQGRMSSAVGRTSFGILLAQDLFVVPLLLLISILGSRGSSSVLATVALTLAQATLAISLILVVGRLMLRPLFRLVAGAQSTEIFIAAILFIIVSTGVVAAFAGLSMSLGAFVAGLLLAETEYRKTVESLIKPFKGLLLGVFFFTVGMSLDATELLQRPATTLLIIVLLLAIKVAVCYALARRFNFTRATALETAVLISAGGEFAFVGIGLARSLDLVDSSFARLVLSATSLSMVLLPLLSLLVRKGLIEPKALLPADPALSIEPLRQSRHAIVVGYGRVGKVVADMLKRHGLAVTAIDSNARTVADDRKHGHDVYYGDASDPDFLATCGVGEASAVIITIHTAPLITRVVEEVRRLNPAIPIVARARDADHASQLYRIGVSDAVPETIEASLQVSEAALVNLGVPMGPVIASIHERRDEFRHMLQEAAQSAGIATTRAVKAKK